ncbi:EAL domain-containing protein [Devosia sp. XJ19-1]|uniref:EAL domain-containing protein n=1 Tax=Devosia ureilytica TaxID=2952754 RepID=A0A9Q4AQ37_9HYPH|nr:EAL domain-containing protein [Devosia ureilytica]MCP8884035.1 EAL domain-containing protein [Devosia ureilytica]MCP8887643.1 EAL domain-containing protein [Devosia ureilytica]
MSAPRTAFSQIDGFVDRAIGADGLSGALREKLLGQQLASVALMVPALMAASLIVSVVFMVVTWGLPSFGVLAALLSAINVIHLYATALASRSRPAQVAGRAATQVVMLALSVGALWAVVLSVLPVEQDIAIRTVALLGAGGLLCISLIALINYPQALASMTIPIVIGSLRGLTGLGQSGDILVQGTLIGGFTFILVTVVFNHAAAFVSLRASEMLVEENGQIIGLLLREFEQTASDWVWGVDDTGVVNRLSGGFTKSTGATEDDLVGADFIAFLHQITAPSDPLVREIERAMADRETFQDVELQIVITGQECWWRLTGKPAFDESGKYLGYLGTGSDISERKISERQITLLAHHDSLTGLLNRTKFTEQLALNVARLERYGTPFSVMFLDLDQFKGVNDSKGHMAGDRLLTEVAARIQHELKEGDVAARFGGDEFAVLLPNAGVKDEVEDLAARLVAAMREPFLIEHDMFLIGASVGIAMAPGDGIRPDHLLRNADLALYRAKADGRSMLRFFESQMDSEQRERRLIEADLRGAIARQELVLHYQPLVNAADGLPTGFEALVRWNHPTRGLVPPAEFIAIAEQSDLIVDIGDWTINEACMAAAAWPEHLTVAVNLSARHFRRSDIGRVVQRALQSSGLAPRRLEIEITEGLLIENPEEVIEKLGEIRAFGVTIAMDDFGTGYSSLSYLLKFPFDKIKIDRSFVVASTNDPIARDILRAIASMAKTLKLKITAEGVETAEQAEFLSEIACHQLQGFYFARPLTPEDLPAYLLSTVAGGATEPVEPLRALAS